MKKRIHRFSGVEEYIAARKQIERRIRMRKIGVIAGLALFFVAGGFWLMRDKGTDLYENSAMVDPGSGEADTLLITDALLSRDDIESYEDFVSPAVDRIIYTDDDLKDADLWEENSTSRNSDHTNDQVSRLIIPPRPDIKPREVVKEEPQKRVSQISRKNTTGQTIRQEDFEDASTMKGFNAPVPPSEAWSSTPKARVYSKPLIMAEKMPVFPGGQSALDAFIQKNLKYPRKAKKTGVEGRVFVRFVVTADGSITQVRINNGLGYGCDEEALRLVNKMPDWIPGENYGDKVPVYYSLPILFSLK